MWGGRSTIDDLRAYITENACEILQKLTHCAWEMDDVGNIRSDRMVIHQAIDLARKLSSNGFKAQALTSRQGPYARVFMEKSAAIQSLIKNYHDIEMTPDFIVSKDYLPDPLDSIDAFFKAANARRFTSAQQKLEEIRRHPELNLPQNIIPGYFKKLSKALVHSTYEDRLNYLDFLMALKKQGIEVVFEDIQPLLLKYLEDDSRVGPDKASTSKDHMLKLLQIIKRSQFNDDAVVDKAIQTRNHLILGYLIDFGLSQNQLPKIYDYAISYGNAGLIMTLLANRYNPSLEQLQKAVSQATHQNKYDVVGALLKAGAKIPEKNIMTMFTQCIKTKNEAGIKIFSQYVRSDLVNDTLRDLILANPTHAGILFLARHPLSESQTLKAFNFAIDTYDWDLFEQLRLTCMPNLQTIRRAMKNAIAQGHEEVVINQLLAKGFNANDEKSKSLLLAVEAKPPKLRIVQALLDCDADPRSHGCRLALLAIDNAYDDDRYAANYLAIAETLVNALQLEQTDKEMVADAFHVYRSGKSTHQAFRDLISSILKGTLSNEKQVAFDLLQTMDALKRRDIEYAGEDSLVSKSNRIFEEKVKTSLQARFAAYPGATDLEKVAAIEKEIKAFILDQIIENAKSEQDEKSKQLMAFVQTNKTQLVEGDEQSMKQMRSLCNSAMDSAQIAWRAYDPKFPHDPNWPNLLTSQTEEKPIHTTAAATIGPVTAKTASEVSRTRVAYYFLDLDKLNKTNFLQQIADIRRAHPHPKNMDSPSCFPGAIGRIGRMGMGHPQFTLPPVRKEIIEKQMNAMVLTTFSSMIKEFPAEKSQKLIAALINPRPESAADLIAGSDPYTTEMLELRQEFIKRLGTRAEIIDRINKAFAAEKETPFKQSDQIDLDFNLLNLGGGSRAHSFQSRLDDHQAALARASKTQVEETVMNPIARFMGMMQSLKAESPDAKRKREKEYTLKLNKRMAQYFEFEALFPEIRKVFSGDSDKAIEITSKIIQSAIDASKKDDKRHTIKDLCVACEAVFRDEADSSKKQKSDCIKIIQEKSALGGVTQSLVDKVNKDIKDQMMFDDPSNEDEKKYNRMLTDTIEKTARRFKITPDAKKISL